MNKRGFIRNDASAEESRSKLTAYGVRAESVVIAPELADALPAFSRGETIVVCSLTDVGVSIPALLRQLSDVVKSGLYLESVDDPWLDMRSECCDWGRLLDGLSDFGQKVASVRTRQALSRVRAEGKRLGRPKGVSGECARKFESGLLLYRNSQMSVRAICEMIGMDLRSFYRCLKASGDVPSRKKGADPCNPE